MFVFDIEVNSAVSNLSIEGKFQPRATTNSPCSGVHSFISLIVELALSSFYYLITDLSRILPVYIVLATASITVLIIAATIIIIVLKKGMSFRF